jgi:ubiquinone/menaquinone biosynthesis C-methylase UbiE
MKDKMKTPREYHKMKKQMRRLVLCVSISLALGISHAAFAEETAGQGNDAARQVNVAKYDEAARGINAPMYDYYARKIKEKTGITKGVCLDVGSGGGHLGLALAQITDLDFTFLDMSANALERAKAHIAEDGLQKRAKTLLADVHAIPLADGSVNLVISRGSIPFWKDAAKALKEIYRVLAPGGKAYVGGGRGTPEIQAQIESKRKALGMGPMGRGPKNVPPRDYDEILKNTGITKYSLNKGDDGMWIEMWK